MASASANPNQFLSIEKLNGNNYRNWSWTMEMQLTTMGLFDVVVEQRPTEDEAKQQKFDNENKRAAAYICLAIDPRITYHIRGLRNAKDIWEKLKRQFDSPSISKQSGIIISLTRKRLNNPRFLNEHINAFMTMLSEFQSFGQDLLESVKLGIFLGSLPEYFEPIIDALQIRGDVDLETAISEVREFQNRKNMNNCKFEEKASADTALANLAEDNLHIKGSSSQRAKGSSQIYRSKARGQQNKQQRSNDKSFNFKKKSSTNFNVGLLNEQSLQSTDYQNQNAIVIDSGATSHYFNRRELFVDIDTSINFPIYLANGDSVIARGKGTILLQTNLGPNRIETLRIPDAYYVPDLKASLYSVRTSTGRGNRVIFKKNFCFGFHGKDLIFRGVLKGDCYQMQILDSYANTVTQCTHKDCLKQWHRRFGHRNTECIKRLANSELARDFNFKQCSNSEKCMECLKAKAVRASYPPVTERQSTRPLDLLYTDLCGPFRQKSAGGNSYFMTIIDDYSRYTYTYLLKEKSQAFEKFKEYFNLVSNRFGYKPKSLRSDNGSEFVNAEFDEFLKEHGIEHQTTQVYTPEQNGVTERMNRTLKEMAVTMLLEANMPKCYWSEAIMTATYLCNRLPTKSKDVTPFQLWNGIKPKLNHLKVFGSKAYTYIPKQKRDKLDCRSEEGIFVGYARNGYRILNPDGRTIKVTSAVYVDERPQSKPNSNQDVYPDLFAVEGDSHQQPEYVTAYYPPHVLHQEGATNVVNQPGDQEPDGVQEAEPGLQSQVRRSERSNRGVPPDRLSYLATEEKVPQPSDWQKIKGLPKSDSQKWVEAAVEEMQSLYKNKTWTLSELPKGKRAIGCKWVFTTKQDAEGVIQRYKARLVAKGYTQQFGEDYNEIFAPVATHTTVRTLLAVAASKKMHVQHLDVKTAFLYGQLDEELYMEQPPGFKTPGKENLVCKLNKSIYGLKQAARAWSEKLNQLLVKEGFTPGTVDKCVYKRFRNNKWTYITCYVDDLILCSQDEADSEEIVNNLKKEIDIKNLGDISHYLGVQIERSSDGSFYLNQKQKIIDLLDCLGLKDANIVATPMEVGFLKDTEKYKPLKNGDMYRTAVGKLLYIANFTRPDIANAVGILCRMVNSPTEKDFIAVKRVARYLKGTADYKLMLPACDQPRLIAYADADWAVDLADRKSTSGNLIFYGGGAISWSSKKQSTIADSSTGAECVSAKAACDEIKWLHNLLMDLGITEPKPTILMQDNQSCIKLSENEKPLKKNIDIAFHKVQEMCRNGLVQLKHCPTEKMIADILTKPLPRDQFQKLREVMKILDVGPRE